MMVLITYDVQVTSDSGAKRLHKVAKACQDYGQRVQNSVFECVLDQVSFIRLKDKIEKIIDLDKDSIRFYFLGRNWKNRIEFIGKVTSYDVTSELII
jgi:CRISPR-associated protein Cas2